MSEIREKKEQFVEELSKDFDDYESFYLVDFMNMSVSKAIELRRELRNNSYVFKVVKNRLALRALREDFPEELKEQFTGPTALAFAPEDPVGLARLIRDFSLKHKLLKVKAGIVEGRYLPGEEFHTVANLSSREDLLAKFGFLMAYPLTQLLKTWQAPFSSMGSMLSQLKSKK
ncbi:MAG: 50S ribosomal protein L10 [Candidatus Aminicenantes bacterium]